MSFDYKIKQTLLSEEVKIKLENLCEKASIVNIDEDTVIESAIMLGINKHILHNIELLNQSLETRIAEQVTPKTMKCRIDKLLDATEELEEYGVSSDTLDKLRTALSIASDSLSLNSSN